MAKKKIILNLPNECETVTQYATKDYDMFIFLDENRDIDFQRVAEIERICIEEDCNFLKNFPIIVNTEIIPGKLAIPDGQHRFLASKGLTEPVYYTINNKFIGEKIAKVSSLQASWKADDYLKYHAGRKNLTYIHLQKIRQENPQIPISALLKIYCNKKAHTLLMEKFRQGNIEITNFGPGTKFLKSLLDFKAIFKDYRSTFFINALTEIMTTDNYDHKVMMSKLTFQSTKLVRCPDTKSYIRVLLDIYNFRNRERLNFNYELLK